MDPLVRAALTVQHAIARGLGTGLAAAFGGYLVYACTGDPDPTLTSIVATCFAISLGLRAFRRLRRLWPTQMARLDLELFTHLFVAGYAGVLHAPGGLRGPYYPLIYALAMLTAAFARPHAVGGTIAFAMTLEGALWTYGLGRPLENLLPHAALLAAFAVLNFAVFRAELARVRKLSRLRLDAELQRLRDDARSYRLIGAPSSAVDTVTDRREAPKGDPERLLRSSVEEIHVALQLSLDLLRRALSLRTAVILWIGESGDRLVVRDISTECECVDRGPFRSAAGVFGAALRNVTPVTLNGRRAAGHVPYYSEPLEVGSVCAVPIVEHGHPRGLLVVDRVADVPFGPGDIDLLMSLARFALRTVENQRVFVQLENAKVEQGKLYRAVDQLAAATTEAQVIEAGVNSARHFAAFDFAVVTLFHRQGQTGQHEICAASGDGAGELVGQTFRHNAGLVSMVVANRHPLPYRGDYDPARQVVFSKRLKPPDMPSLIVLPLSVHDNALGTLVLGSNQKNAFGDSVRPTLEVLARHVAVSLANARMVKRLEDLATTDGLTGHFNKRALTEVARQKIRSAQRFKKPLALLVCDIDHFKKVNDTHGHDMGDVVIKGFADVLRHTKRETDAVGRFGGEEFVLVCEETDGDGAELLAERIRSELETTTFHTDQGPLTVTCSVGVATFPQAGTDWESLFKATDEALYVSKRSGRNRVTIWTPRMRGAAA